MLWYSGYCARKKVSLDIILLYPSISDIVSDHILLFYQILSRVGSPCRRIHSVCYSLEAVQVFNGQLLLLSIYYTGGGDCEVAKIDGRRCPWALQEMLTDCWLSMTRDV